MARLLLDLKPDSDNRETHKNRTPRSNLAALVNELGGDHLGGAGEEGWGEALGGDGTQVSITWVLPGPLGADLGASAKTNLYKNRETVGTLQLVSDIF